MKIIHATTSKAKEEEIDHIYENINRALKVSGYTQTFLTGDWDRLE